MVQPLDDYKAASADTLVDTDETFRLQRERIDALTEQVAAMERKLTSAVRETEMLRGRVIDAINNADPSDVDLIQALLGLNE